MVKNETKFNFIFTPFISILIIIGLVTIPLTNAVAIDIADKDRSRPLIDLDLPEKINDPPQVLDSNLEKILDSSDLDGKLEVIIQFKDKVLDRDLDLLEDLNFKIKHQYTVLPAIYAEASKASIIALSEYDRTFWVEYNEPMDLFMEQSLLTVNATHAWDSMVIDESGNEISPIDGTGVTVVVLDTGIDAGHPDLDYGEKTLVNLKSDTGVGPWVDMEDSDTSYGHGTHCAGTVAGNGEASGSG